MNSNNNGNNSKNDGYNYNYNNLIKSGAHSKHTNVHFMLSFHAQDYLENLF